MPNDAINLPETERHALMSGSQPPRRTGNDVDPFVAALAFLVIALGCLDFWWWSIGDVARIEWLTRIQRGSGYSPPPRDMLAQVEWLATSRMNDLANMFMLFILAATAGITQGNAKRQAQALSGFGLMRLQFGRGLLMLWLGLVVVSMAAPIPLPYGLVGAVLSLGLFLAMYNLGRGFRRVH